MFKLSYGCNPYDIVMLILEHFRLRIGLRSYRKGKKIILVPKILGVSQSVRLAFRGVKAFVLSFNGSSVSAINALQFNLFNFLTAFMVGDINYVATKQGIFRFAWRNRRYLHFR
jgi:hypothetical protein